jgi:two-component system OmpR family response regulator
MNKILHIDDEMDILEVARMALEDIGGLTVTSASSSLEGQALALSLNPDLILLDVMMPGMDGLETLKALRKNPATHSIPIIFMTAKVQTDELGRYMALGALGVIAKPFDPMTLADELKTIWKSERDRSMATK